MSLSKRVRFLFGVFVVVGFFTISALGVRAASYIGYGLADSWYDLQQAGRAGAFLDELSGAGANATSIEALSAPNEVRSAWGRTSSGYDLTTHSETYFGVLSGYTNAASQRGISTLVVAVNANYGVKGGWNTHPFNPANNINPETDSLNNGQTFYNELGLAVAGDTSTPTRAFLRTVWEAYIKRLASSTPSGTLLEPIAEDWNANVNYDRNAYYQQIDQWWGKGNLVQNTRGISSPPVSRAPSADFEDFHDGNQNYDNLRSGIIVHTDDRCNPPTDSVITNMAREGVSRNGNYIVYDCQTQGASWMQRVIDALRAALNGTQPDEPPGGGSPGGGTPGGGTSCGVGNSPQPSASDISQLESGNFSNVTWIDRNVSSWPQDLDVGMTVSIRGSGPPQPGDQSYGVFEYRWNGDIFPDECYAHSTTCSDDPNDDRDQIHANVWIFAFRNGRWYASTWDWMRKNTRDRDLEPLLFPGGGDSRGELGNFAMKPGETYFQMISGAARNQCNCLDVRSNLVKFTYNGQAGACSEDEPPPPATEPPVITSIDPPVIAPGQELVITGENLGTTVILTNTETGATYTVIGVLSEGNTVLTVIIPNDIPSGTYTVTVENEVGSDTADQTIQIAAGGRSFDCPGLGPIPITEMNFGQFIEFLFEFGLYLLGISVFVNVFWAATLWFTAAGNSGQVSKARSKIFNAIIGAILLISSYVILNTINPDLVNGRIDLPSFERGGSEGCVPGEGSQP